MRNDGTVDGDLVAEIRIGVLADFVASWIAVVGWVRVDCPVPDKTACE